MLERSRVGEEGKVGLAEFGAEMDLRSPLRYGEYIGLGERRASSGRKPAIVAVCCMCSWWLVGTGGRARRFGLKVKSLVTELPSWRADDSVAQCW